MKLTLTVRRRSRGGWNPRRNKQIIPVLVSIALATVVLGGSVFAAIQLFPSSVTGNAPWYNSAWSHRLEITVQHSQVAADQTNFPIYVDLSNLPASFFSDVQADGGDVRVTTDDGQTEVPREVAAIDTSAKTGELYFKALSLSSGTDTSFYIYYGDSGAPAYAATDTYGSRNVWSNGYTAVYHLGNDPSGSAPQIIDSTGNGNGTANGSMPSADLVAGKDGKALNFDGSNDYVTLAGTIPTGPSTFEAWEKTSSAAEMGIIGKLSYWTDSYGYGLYMQSHSIKALAYSAGSGLGPLATPVVDSNWHYGAFTTDSWGAGTNGDLYLDGALSASGSGPAAYYPTYAYTIGSGHTSTSRLFAGLLDEIRVSSVDRSAAWISTSYNDENAPASFYTVGSPQAFSSKTSQVNAAAGENGLVGWWKMDGNAKDSTPNADNGTVSGATLTTDRHGVTNSAYAFTAGGHSITTPMASTSYAAGLTLSAWIKPTAYPPERSTIIVGQLPNSYYLSLNSDGSVQTYWYGRNPEGYFSSGAGTVPLNQWSLVTAVWDSGHVYLYVDGVLKTTTATTGAGVVPTQLVFGAESSSRQFVGALDDLRIYKRALSTADVSNMYNSYNSQLELGGSGAAGSISLGKGLIGEWDLNGNAKDATPYSDNGTVIGATLTTDREGRASSAYGFNGSGQYIDAGPSRLTGSQAFTLSVWLDTTQMSRYSGAVAIGPSGSNQSAYIGTVNLAQVGTSNSLGGGFYGANYGTGVTTTNQWVLVTMTFSGGSGGTAIIYINGVPKVTTTASPSLAGGETKLGRIGTDTIYDFSGALDDARIWNRALSAAEVTALYNEYR